MAGRGIQEQKMGKTPSHPAPMPKEEIQNKKGKETMGKIKHETYVLILIGR